MYFNYESTLPLCNCNKLSGSNRMTPNKPPSSIQKSPEIITDPKTYQRFSVSVQNVICYTKCTSFLEEI